MIIRLLLLAFLTTVLAGCATSSTNNTDSRSASVDPYEGFNRRVYGFNSGVDKYFLKPVTKTYRFITPDFVEKGISNFFSNLLEIRNIVNALLQGKGGKAIDYSGRFVFNSTIGLGGLFDVASPMGIEKPEGEDFGQTLGA